MKMLLVATTALVCVTSLATAGTLPERQSGLSSGKLDTNREFLCNYGFKIRVGFGSESGFSSASRIRAATPVVGRGKSVNEIIVEDGSSLGSSYNDGFQVALYSSHNKKPKKEIVSASVPPRACGLTHVPISPITLERGKEYWIVETALLSVSRGNRQSRQVRLRAPQFSTSNTIVWIYDKPRTRGALWQHSSSFCYITCSHHRGPWEPMTSGVPYARVRESIGAFEAPRPLQSEGASKGMLSPASVPMTRVMHEGRTPRYPP